MADRGADGLGLKVDCTGQFLPSGAVEINYGQTGFIDTGLQGKAGVAEDQGDRRIEFGALWTQGISQKNRVAGLSGRRIGNCGCSKRSQRLVGGSQHLDTGGNFQLDLAVLAL